VLLVAHRTPATRLGCERLAHAGASVFEVDVQVDGDAGIVVSHYFPVGRFALLQRDNWRLRWHTGGKRDPRLHELEALVPPHCAILLDLKEKSPDRRARLCQALIAALPHRDRFIACGPHADDLAELRAAGFRTWRTIGRSGQLGTVLEAGRLPDAAVTIRHTLVSPQVLDRLHQLVPDVVAWTVNSLGRAEQLRAMGVDGVTTDRLAVLRALTR
jgi:glycerophosphoryl diester phosphodiesterase